MVEFIPLIPIASSNLHAVGYDDAAITLAVQFKNGDIFHYRDVPETVWSEMQQAPSKGSFYAKEIRGKFKGEKMTGSCNRCGDGPGYLATACSSCGCGAYVDVREARA